MVDYVPNEEMRDYYSLLDVIAFPSYSEGFPNVLLEAAAMELPVVAAKVTGSVDAVQDQVTGTLVPVRDAQSLERALMNYLQDRELRLKHGRAARTRVLREFRPQPVWEAVHREYEMLLEAKGIRFPRQTNSMTCPTESPVLKDS